MGLIVITVTSLSRYLSLSLSLSLTHTHTHFLSLSLTLPVSSSCLLPLTNSYYDVCPYSELWRHPSTNSENISPVLVMLKTRWGRKKYCCHATSSLSFFTSLLFSPQFLPLHLFSHLFYFSPFIYRFILFFLSFFFSFAKGFWSGGELCHQLPFAWRHGRWKLQVKHITHI